MTSVMFSNSTHVRAVLVFVVLFAAILRTGWKGRKDRTELWEIIAVGSFVLAIPAMALVPALRGVFVFVPLLLFAIVAGSLAIVSRRRRRTR